MTHYPNDKDLARIRKLEEGWEYELSQQQKEEEKEEEKPEISSPQNDDSCASKSVKILFLLFVISSQFYQIIT